MTDLACLIIADDFTGACDTGLQLVRDGLSARVRADWSGAESPSVETDVLVVDTGSRNLAAGEAAHRARAACDSVSSVNAELFYKKVDSTARGHLGAEIGTIMQARCLDLCLLAPALPEAGRTTIQGHHLLRGVPVHLREFGVDPGAPVRDSRLPRRLAREVSDLQVELIELETISEGPEAIVTAMRDRQSTTGTIFVADAATADNLSTIVRAARAFDEPLLLSGSAGLARHLTDAFGLESRIATVPPVEPRPGLVLVVVGSANSTSQTQAEALRRGMKVQEWSVEGASEIADEVVGYLHDCEENTSGSPAVALLSLTAGKASLERASRTVRELADSAVIAGVAITGGTTATATLRALESDGVEIVEAVGSEVPLCRLTGGPFQGLPIVTKGGALGEEDVFLKAASRLGNTEPGRVEPAHSWMAVSADAEDRPLLAITMGDPCGVGAEVIVKALAEEEAQRLCRPLVIGEPSILEGLADLAGRPIDINPVNTPEEAVFSATSIDVLNPIDVDTSALTPGVVCREGGRAAVEWVKGAVRLALDDRVDGIVTAPLNKEAMNLAGFAYAGHTELLGEQTGTRNYRMMLASRRLNVIHVTTHVALRSVPDRLTIERVFETIQLGQQALVDSGFERPRIAVAGLNPHAGESGLFGDEDARAIAPAVQQSREQGWDVSGPLPGDTLFHRAYNGEFDGIVAMFHDQGHIPIKLVAFADAVNVTLGLPIVRASVDHGTAFDIVGKGIADHENMVYAIAMGARLASARLAKGAS